MLSSHSAPRTINNHPKTNLLAFSFSPEQTRAATDYSIAQEPIGFHYSGSPESGYYSLQARQHHHESSAPDSTQSRNRAHRVELQPPFTTDHDDPTADALPRQFQRVELDADQHHECDPQGAHTRPESVESEDQHLEAFHRRHELPRGTTASLQAVIGNDDFQHKAPAHIQPNGDHNLPTQAKEPQLHSVGDFDQIEGFEDDELYSHDAEQELGDNSQDCKSVARAASSWTRLDSQATPRTTTKQFREADPGATAHAACGSEDTDALATPDRNSECSVEPSDYGIDVSGASTTCLTPWTNSSSQSEAATSPWTPLSNGQSPAVMTQGYTEGQPSRDGQTPPNKKRKTNDSGHKGSGNAQKKSGDKQESQDGTDGNGSGGQSSLATSKKGPSKTHVCFINTGQKRSKFPYPSGLLKHAKEKHDVSFCETCFCLLTSKDMRKAHYKEHKCAPYCVSTKCKKAASNATGSNQRHEKRDSCPRKACGDDELSYLVALYEQHRAIDTTDAPVHLDDNIVAGLHKIISCFLELCGTEINHPELKQHLQDFAPELLKKHLQNHAPAIPAVAPNTINDSISPGQVITSPEEQHRPGSHWVARAVESGSGTTLNGGITPQHQSQPDPWTQNPGLQRFVNTAGGNPLDFPFPPSGAMPSNTNNFSPYAPLDYANLTAPPLMDPVSGTMQIPPPPANPQYLFNPMETNGMHWPNSHPRTYFDQAIFAPNIQFPQPPHQQQHGAQAYDSADQQFATYQPVQPQYYGQMDQQNQAYPQQPQPQPQYHGPQNNNFTPYPQPSNHFGPQQENRNYHQRYPQHGQR